LTDFLHTTIALILLIYFSLGVLTSKHIGGVSGLYEKVKATNDYIPGNYEGSLLTMKSKSCGQTLQFASSINANFQISSTVWPCAEIW